MKKIISILILVLFLVQNLLCSTGWASSLPMVSEVRIAAPFKLDLPADLGRIENLTSGSGPVIIHIQTAHGNYEAQKKIQSILKVLHESYGVNLLLLEGSAVKLRPELLRFFPNQADISAAISDKLAQKALIKGSELFLAENQDAEAYGIEDLQAYKENGKAFASVLTQQEKTRSFLQDMDMQVGRLTGPYVSKELRSFLKRRDDYSSRIIPLTDWIASLKEYALNVLETDLADSARQIDWPMLVRYFKLQEFEKHLDRAHLEMERSQFFAAIQPHVKPAVYDEIKRLLDQSLSNNELPDPETGRLFEDMAASLPDGFDFSMYPNIKYFIGHLILQSELKADKLMEEVERLQAKIADHLAASPEEKQILALLNDHALLKKLFALELTPHDYEVLLQRGADINPANVIGRFLELNKNQRVLNVEFGHIPEIQLLFENAQKFYQYAKKRDALMIEKITERMRLSGADKAVVVTGGFHSGPFKDYFSGHGYNYALVAPQITTLDGREAYEQSILQHQRTSPAASSYESPYPFSMSPREVQDHGFSPLSFIPALVQAADQVLREHGIEDSPQALANRLNGTRYVGQLGGIGLASQQNGQGQAGFQIHINRAPGQNVWVRAAQRGAVVNAEAVAPNAGQPASIEAFSRLRVENLTGRSEVRSNRLRWFETSRYAENRNFFDYNSPFNFDTYKMPDAWAALFKSPDLAEEDARWWAAWIKAIMKDDASAVWSKPSFLPLEQKEFQDFVTQIQRLRTSQQLENLIFTPVFKKILEPLFSPVVYSKDSPLADDYHRPLTALYSLLSALKALRGFAPARLEAEDLSEFNSGEKRVLSLPVRQLKEIRFNRQSLLGVPGKNDFSLTFKQTPEGLTAVLLGADSKPLKPKLKWMIPDDEPVALLIVPIPAFVDQPMEVLRMSPGRAETLASGKMPYLILQREHDKLVILGSAYSKGTVAFYSRSKLQKMAGVRSEVRNTPEDKPVSGNAPGWGRSLLIFGVGLLAGLAVYHFAFREIPNMNSPVAVLKDAGEKKPELPAAAVVKKTPVIKGTKEEVKLVEPMPETPVEVAPKETPVTDTLSLEEFAKLPLEKQREIFYRDALVRKAFERPSLAPAKTPRHFSEEVLDNKKVREEFQAVSPVIEKFLISRGLWDAKYKNAPNSLDWYGRFFKLAYIQDDPRDLDFANYMKLYPEVSAKVIAFYKAHGGSRLFEYRKHSVSDMFDASQWKEIRKSWALYLAKEKLPNIPVEEFLGDVRTLISGNSLRSNIFSGEEFGPAHPNRDAVTPLLDSREREQRLLKQLNDYLKNPEAFRADQKRLRAAYLGNVKNPKGKDEDWNLRFNWATFFDPNDFAGSIQQKFVNPNPLSLSFVTASPFVRKEADIIWLRDRYSGGMRRFKMLPQEFAHLPEISATSPLDWKMDGWERSGLGKGHPKVVELLRVLGEPLPENGVVPLTPITMTEYSRGLYLTGKTERALLGRRLSIPDGTEHPLIERFSEGFTIWHMLHYRLLGKEKIPSRISDFFNEDQVDQVAKAHSLVWPVVRQLHEPEWGRFFLKDFIDGHLLNPKAKDGDIKDFVDKIAKATGEKLPGWSPEIQARMFLPYEEYLAHRNDKNDWVRRTGGSLWLFTMETAGQVYINLTLAEIADALEAGISIDQPQEIKKYIELKQAIRPGVEKLYGRLNLSDPEQAGLLSAMTRNFYWRNIDSKAANRFLTMAANPEAQSEYLQIFNLMTGQELKQWTLDAKNPLHGNFLMSMAERIASRETFLRWEAFLKNKVHRAESAKLAGDFRVFWTGEASYGAEDFKTLASNSDDERIFSWLQSIGDFMRTGSSWPVWRDQERRVLEALKSSPPKESGARSEVRKTSRIENKMSLPVLTGSESFSPSEKWVAIQLTDGIIRLFDQVRLLRDKGLQGFVNVLGAEILGRPAYAEALQAMMPAEGFLTRMTGAARVRLSENILAPDVRTQSIRTSENAAEPAGILLLEESALEAFAKNPRALFLLFLQANRLKTGNAPAVVTLVPANEMAPLKSRILSVLHKKGAALGSELSELRTLESALKEGSLIQFVSPEAGESTADATRKLIRLHQGGVVEWHVLPSDVPADLKTLGVHFALGSDINKNDLTALVVAAVLTRKLADRIRDLNGKSALKPELLRKEIEVFIQKELPGFLADKSGIVTPHDLAQFIEFAYKTAGYIQSMA